MVAGTGVGIIFCRRNTDVCTHELSYKDACDCTRDI